MSLVATGSMRAPCAFRDVMLATRLLVMLALAVGTHGQAHQIRADWMTPNNEYVMAFVNVTFRDPVRSSELHHLRGEIGKYADGLVAVAAGRLVHVRARNGTKHDGCSRQWEKVTSPEEAWIALVQQGGCTADVKVENAYRANASALVVYDDQPRRVMERLHLTAEHRDSIVTVFIRKKDGEDLAGRVDGGVEVRMQLTPGKRVPYSVEKLNRTSVLFVSMSFILLLVISLAWLLFYYVQRFRYMHAKDRLARHLVSAARKALSRVPLRTLKVDDEQLGDAECCAVCLETYRAAECVRMLPCSHQFHMVCVDPWLLKNRSCPMCKMDILKYYGMTVVTGEEGLPQVGSPTEPSSPEPMPVHLPSGGSSPQHGDRRHQPPPPMPPSLVRLTSPPLSGRTEVSTCTAAAGSSTCTVVAGGSTCTAVPGGSTCADVVDAADVQMSLRCSRLPDCSQAGTSPCSETAGVSSVSSDAASVASTLHSASLTDRRLSLPDDDSSLSESGGTFQSCHPASCESLSSGSPDVSQVAEAPAAVAVVHVSDETELVT